MSADNKHDGRDFRDDDLQARFTVLRREEEAQAPEFALPTRGSAVRRRRWRPRRFVFVVSFLVVMLAVFLWMRTGPTGSSRRPDSQVASLVDWKASTDFLLETPGRGLLQTVPEIGGWPDSGTTHQPAQKHPPARKKVSP